MTRRFLTCAATSLALIGSGFACHRVATPPPIAAAPVAPAPLVPAALTVSNGWRDLKFGMSEPEVERVISRYQGPSSAKWRRSSTGTLPTIRMSADAIDEPQAPSRYQEWGSENLDVGAGRVRAWFDDGNLVAVEVEGTAKARVFEDKAAKAYGEPKAIQMFFGDGAGGSQQRTVSVWAGAQASAFVWDTTRAPVLLIWANDPMAARAAEYQAEIDAPRRAAEAVEQSEANGTIF